MPKNIFRCHQETHPSYLYPNVIKTRKSYIDNVRESRMEGMFLGGIRQFLSRLLEENKKAPININQKQLL